MGAGYGVRDMRVDVITDQLQLFLQPHPRSKVDE